jgi:uncharacterized protein (TIGR04255 family)
MFLNTHPKISYGRNPIAEVVCQIRYSATTMIDYRPESRLSTELQKLGYVARTVENQISIGVNISGGIANKASQEENSVHHFKSDSNAYQASISNDFFAITSTKYEGWGDFRRRIDALYVLLTDLIPDLAPTRVGLRYRDIIDRSVLALESDSNQWHTLISPFLLGPLARPPIKTDESMGIDELDVAAFAMQSQIRLQDCWLILQSALLKATDDTNRTAFLVDSDFFTEFEEQKKQISSSELMVLLESLHGQAYGVFRNSITEKLHHALDPR